MSEEKVIPKRLTSLDAFRGFTIIAMLLVNNAGYDSASSRQFRHAHWGEFITFCDLIFPWFLFIVGVAIPFSIASFRKKSVKFSSYFGKTFRRMLILVIFGILIDSSISKRIAIGLDVLQLIGLAYFCAAMIYELPKQWRLGIAGILLVSHWVLIRFVPIPGLGAGFFEPDKNIIFYLNQFLRPYHLAGIISVVPTTALVLIGTYIGDLLREDKFPVSKKLKYLFLGGIILSIIGLLWHLDLQMSKDVWTASYITFTAGLGCIVFGIFYYLIDIKGYKKWAFPGVVYGMNAITAYFFSIMVRVHTVQEWKTLDPDGQQITVWQAYLNFWTNFVGINLGSWLFTLSYITFWWIVLYWMYRKKLFLRV